jgi:hypothetical protein
MNRASVITHGLQERGDALAEFDESPCKLSLKRRLQGQRQFSLDVNEFEFRYDIPKRDH